MEPSQPVQRRILGLDVGDRRIGVAVSDELGLTAQPVLTLTRRDRRQDVAHRHLDAAGRTGNRRGVIDQVAAVLILQSFLDSRR